MRYAVRKGLQVADGFSESRGALIDALLKFLVCPLELVLCLAQVLLSMFVLLEFTP